MKAGFAGAKHPVVAGSFAKIAGRLFAAENGSTLAFGLRNIHTWTSFTGVDPEQNFGVNGNEVTNDFNTSPPPTYITFRLNLRY